MHLKLSRLFVSLLPVLAGCASSSIGNFDRHALSRLYPAPSGSELVFEASVSPQYPADSEAAEATRMQWIELWLDQRNLCADGFEIKDRIAIGSAADNPYQHDLRYTLACAEAPANK